MFGWLRRAPGRRFCRGCGKQIVVERQPVFDPYTGEEDTTKGWYWHCPMVAIEMMGNEVIRTSWRGSVPHDCGPGEPYWHRREREDSEWAAT